VHIAMGTQYSTVVLPVLPACGLSKLGGGGGPEPMLVAFVDTVNLVYQTLNADEPTLVRRSHMHKAETERLHGQNWWPKACRSDRHAAVLINSDMKDGKAKRLYVYLGGGSLTSANTELAQGVVCRCKTWSMAVAVLIAARFLSLCVPGDMMTLKKELIVARGQDGEEEAALLDEDDEDLEAGGPAGLDLDETFLQTFRAESTRATAVLCKTGHPGEALGGWVCSNVTKAEEQAHAALMTTKEWAKGLHNARDCGPADAQKRKVA